jgi:hypothetical protein
MPKRAVAKRLYFCPFCPPGEHSNKSIGHLRRHVRGKQCVNGHEDLFTPEVEVRVRRDSYNRHFENLRRGQNEQVGLVQTAAREQVLVHQVEEKRNDRQKRRDRDTLARKRRVSAKRVADEVAVDVEAGIEQRRALAVGRATLIEDRESREAAMSVALKYGEYMMT